MAIYLNISENQQNHRIRLTSKPFFMGRSNKCHLTVTDSMVSGKHLAIKINSELRVVIKDLDTTNGTYLNGNKIQESLFYIEDFIQVGKIKITLDESEMTANELKLHKRDFERTNVTFVRLGANVGFDEDEEDEFGVSKQKTLLAKIRRMKENEETINADDLQQKEADSVKTQDSSNKKRRKVVNASTSNKSGIVGKLKGFFKKA